MYYNVRPSQLVSYHFTFIKVRQDVLGLPCIKKPVSVCTHISSFLFRSIATTAVTAALLSDADIYPVAIISPFLRMENVLIVREKIKAEIKYSPSISISNFPIFLIADMFLILYEVDTSSNFTTYPLGLSP